MASKIKHAYINYNQIQPLIDNGKLDKYDLVIAKDKKNLYIIDENLNIQPVVSNIGSTGNTDSTDYIKAEQFEDICCCEEDILKLFL